MQKVKLLAFLSFMFIHCGISAQEQLIDENHIPLTKAQSFNALIELHKQINLLDSSIPGFRIQIFFESGNYSKSLALEVKQEFETKYLNQKAYVSFNEPYYRVRVGDFRSKIEAIGFLKKIIRKYPNAFEVEDRISIGI